MMAPPSTSPPGKWRLLGAFAFLPLLNALLGYLAFPVVWWLGGQGGTISRADGGQPAAGFAILTGMLGLLVTVCGAIPVVFWLMRRGTVALRDVLVAGVLLGNAPFAVYAFAILCFSVAHLAAGTLSGHLSPASELFAATLRVVAIGSFFGMTSAAVFWLLGLRGTAVAR